MVKVGVGKGLVLEREMPPFTVQWFEIVAEHGLAQYHSVTKLLRGN